MADKSRRRPRELSVGEEQRIAIARALVHGPKVILADEPTGNLDSANAQNILRLFREINGGGQTIIMITHNDEAAKAAGRILRMKDGKIV